MKQVRQHVLPGFDFAHTFAVLSASLRVIELYDMNSSPWLLMEARFRGYRHQNGNIAGYGVLRELGLLLLYYTASYAKVARGGGQVNGWERTLVYLGLKRRRRVLWEVESQMRRVVPAV
jgi:hypothetical protein